EDQRSADPEDGRLLAPQRREVRDHFGIRRLRRRAYRRARGEEPPSVRFPGPQGRRPAQRRGTDRQGSLRQPRQALSQRVGAVDQRRDAVAEGRGLAFRYPGVVADALELDRVAIEDRELGELVPALARGVDRPWIDEVGLSGVQNDPLPGDFRDFAIHLVDLLLVAVAEEADADAREVLPQ